MDLGSLFLKADIQCLESRIDTIEKMLCSILFEEKDNIELYKPFFKDLNLPQENND
jgi:uncharacterized protein Yka (UPF0111/DUF47 family)